MYTIYENDCYSNHDPLVYISRLAANNVEPKKHNLSQRPEPGRKRMNVNRGESRRSRKKKKPAFHQGALKQFPPESEKRRDSWHKEDPVSTKVGKVTLKIRIPFFMLFRIVLYIFLAFFSLLIVRRYFMTNYANEIPMSSDLYTACISLFLPPPPHTHTPTHLHGPVMSFKAAMDTLIS